MSEDGPLLSLDQVRAAAAVGRLPELAQQLVLDQRWSSVEVLLTMASAPTLPLEDVTSALDALLGALGALPDRLRKAAQDELREAQRHAAAALIRRSDKPTPMTERERQAIAVAAILFADLGELRRAAELFEKAGDEERAADAWGALGELERMEACLARDEARRRARIGTAEARRRFDLLASGGERLAAVRAAAELPATDLDSQDVRLRARNLEERLCRGRAVALRLPEGRLLRLAGAPALLGRDASADLVLREPTVSRRHARLVADAAGLAVEDAGSRGGTLIAGVPLAGRIVLRGEGELALGATCLLRYRVIADGLVELRGTRGLDRELWILAGAGRVPLGPVLPEASALALDFSAGVARLVLVAQGILRVGGHLVGAACDLVHGDVVELDGRLRLEVP